MAKERPKVKSLEETGSEMHVLQQPPLLQSKPTLKKQKSMYVSIPSVTTCRLIFSTSAPRIVNPQMVDH
jgi:hypothetical protein